MSSLFIFLFFDMGSLKQMDFTEEWNIYSKI